MGPSPALNTWSQDWLLACTSSRAQDPELPPSPVGNSRRDGTVAAAQRPAVRSACCARAHLQTHEPAGPTRWQTPRGTFVFTARGDRRHDNAQPPNIVCRSCALPTDDRCPGPASEDRPCGEREARWDRRHRSTPGKRLQIVATTGRGRPAEGGSQGGMGGGKRPTLPPHAVGVCHKGQFVV